MKKEEEWSRENIERKIATLKLREIETPTTPTPIYSSVTLV